MQYQYDYNQKGKGYARQRQTDPYIASYVHAALASAKTVLNVGAGAGSYEPVDRHVLAIEPSMAMRAQRPAHLSPAIAGTAESLPLDNRSVDASMAMITIHHWEDLEEGILEMRRVSRQRVLIMTFDPGALDAFWNISYFPEVVAAERQRYPTVEEIMTILDRKCEVQAIPIPLHCVDGFQEAFYGRPEAFLDKTVRKAQSAWGFIPEGLEDTIVERLADDLRSGKWDQQFGHLRTQPYFAGALRLIIAHL